VKTVVRAIVVRVGALQSAT